MKKIRLSAIALFVCVLAMVGVSCQKDGVYKPKNKISRIYTQRDGHAKILEQTWNWDKGLLSSVTYNEDDVVLNFLYDGKRLTSIVVEGEAMNFEYDGSALTRMTLSDEGELLAEYTFKHDGKLITEIETRMDASLAKGINSRLLKTAFNLVAPQMAETQLEQIAIAQESQIKGIYTYTDVLTYDGKNVISMKRHDSDQKNYEYTYTYSDKLNPFYHMLYGGEDIVGLGLSKNAVATYHYEDDVIHSRTIDLEVTFPSLDGKFPLQETRTLKTTHNVGGLTNIYSQVDHYFYEYE